jgi:Leucine Rich repeat
LLHRQRLPFVTEALKKNASLKVLGLGRNSLGDMGAEALAVSLSMNKSLTLLSLVENNVGSTGAMALARSLKRNTRLNTFYFGQNVLNSDGLTSFAEGLATNKSLTDLHLDLCLIDDNGAVLLGESLKRNVTLKNLSLQGNCIGSTGAKAILDALKRHNRSLTSLDLSNNPDVSTSILSAINGILRSNKAGTRPYSIRPSKVAFQTSISKLAPALAPQNVQVAAHQVPVDNPSSVGGTQHSQAAIGQLVVVSPLLPAPLAVATALSVLECGTDAQGRTYYCDREQPAQLTAEPSAPLAALPPFGVAQQVAPRVKSAANDSAKLTTTTRAELDFEMRRLTIIRDGCMGNFDDDQWEKSVAAEKKIHEILTAISKGSHPTGDELEAQVKDLMISIRDKVRSESVAAAMPLRERLLQLQKHLSREREAEARARDDELAGLSLYEIQ